MSKNDERLLSLVFTNIVSVVYESMIACRCTCCTGSSCKGEQKMHQSSGMAMLFIPMIHGLSVFIVVILFIIAAVNYGADHSGSYSWHSSMIVDLFVVLFSMLHVCLRICVQRSLAAAGKESYEVVTTGNPSNTIGSTGRAASNRANSPPIAMVVGWSPDAHTGNARESLA